MPRAASARRYAQAIFELARERGELSLWLGDLGRLAEILGDREVQAFLENPKIGFSQKRQILDQHLAGLHPLARNLAYLLVVKGRVPLAPALREEYQRYLDAHEGIEPAEVVTAVPLSEGEQQGVAGRLRQITGKELRLSIAVDPDILGGLVARVGGRVLDGSTRSRLRALRENLQARTS